MPNQNNSVEIFTRFVSQRFAEVKDRYATLLTSLAGQDTAAKLTNAKATIEAIRALEMALATQDHSPWLKPIHEALEHYIQQGGHVNSHASVMNRLAVNYGPCVSHEWVFDFSGDKPFDFDGLYRQYEEQSGIPTLFDKIVEVLEKIVASEALDRGGILFNRGRPHPGTHWEG